MEESNNQQVKGGMQAQIKNITPKVTSIDEVYTELIQLRNKNRALEGRIKQLENQNFSITQQNFGQFTSPEAVRTTPQPLLQNGEPNRPHFK